MQMFETPKESLLNFLSFPYRAFILNPNMSSGRFFCLRDERMFYVSRHCKGRVLDIGCGPGNYFIKNFCSNESVGIDVFKYPGLDDVQIVPDMCQLPFQDCSFDTVTLIANINHIPRSIIKEEFKEISRILKPEGRLIITRIGPVISWMTHTVLKIQSMISDKYYDMDTERGMEHDERLSVPRIEIDHLCRTNELYPLLIEKFWTQWWLNEVLVFKKN